MKQQDLIEAAEKLIGDNEEIEAAGVFGLQDSYKAITAAGAASSLLPTGHSAAVSSLETAATIEAARQANAAAEGVSERMGIVVTAEQIHVLRLSPMGTEVKGKLLSFDRANTDVEIKKFGLSRRIHLHDRESDRKLELTGSTVRVSRAAEGDKAVLAELGR